MADFDAQAWTLLGAAAMPRSQRLAQTIAERIGSCPERQGLIVRDLESSYPALDPNDSAPTDNRMGHSITYRIAVGPRQGEKVMKRRTAALATDANEATRLALSLGFSLLAGGSTPTPK